MAEVFLKKPSWYQTWWGVALAAAGVLALAVVFLLGFLVTKYWRQIKQGEGEALKKEIFGQIKPPMDLAAQEELKLKRRELESEREPFLGNPNAPVVIVEFIDFKCPHTLVEEPVIKKMMQKYGYKIKLIVRDFPVESRYAGTSKFSELAFCAAEQDKYWTLDDFLFDRQSELPAELSDQLVDEISSEIGLKSALIKTCLSSGRAKIGVNSDYAVGFKYGVPGTPTFFVNGEKAAGTVPWETWDGYLKNF